MHKTTKKNIESSVDEVYCGFEKGKLSNLDGYKFNQVAVYDRPVEIEDKTIALNGKFLAKREYIEARQIGAEILLKFLANEINLNVTAPEGSAVLEIFFNGESLPSHYYGEDVNDKGEIKIGEFGVYNIFKADTPTDGILSIREKRKRFRIFKFLLKS